MRRHQKPIEDTSPGHCHILVIYFVFCLRERRFQRLFDATLDRWKLSQFTHLPRPLLLSHPQYLAQLFVYLIASLAWKLIPNTSLNSATIPDISRGFHRLPTTMPLFPCLFLFSPLFSLLSCCLTLSGINPHYLTHICYLIPATLPKLSKSFLLPRAYQTQSLWFNSYLITSLYFTSIPTTSPMFSTTS